MTKASPQLIPLILTRHDSSCRKAYALLEQVLKKAGFPRIQKFECDGPQQSPLSEKIKPFTGSWILLIDICKDFLIFDYKMLLDIPLTHATMFLGYQNLSPRAPYLIEDGWSAPLTIQTHKTWADHYTATGSYALPAKALLDWLQSHSTNNFLPELTKEKASFKGLPLASKIIRLDHIETDMTSWSIQKEKARPCLFLDRDGVIIEDLGFVYKPQDLKIIPDVLPLIRWAKQRNWLVIIISNQSGVARKKFSVEALENFTNLLKAKLKDAGAEPDHWYYCPFHEEGLDPEYAFASVLRKPAPGMILQAMNDYPIAIKESFMIGDRLSDAIPVPGLRTLLIRRQYPLALDIPIFDDLNQVLCFLQELEDSI